MTYPTAHRARGEGTRKAGRCRVTGCGFAFGRKDRCVSRRRRDMPALNPQAADDDPHRRSPPPQWQQLSPRAVPLGRSSPKTSSLCSSHRRRSCCRRPRARQRFPAQTGRRMGLSMPLLQIGDGVSSATKVIGSSPDTAR